MHDFTSLLLKRPIIVHCFIMHLRTRWK